MKRYYKGNVFQDVLLTARTKDEVKVQSTERFQDGEEQRKNLIDDSQQRLPTVNNEEKQTCQVDYNNKMIIKPTGLGKHSMEIPKKQGNLMHSKMSKEAWNEEVVVAVQGE